MKLKILLFFCSLATVVTHAQSNRYSFSEPKMGSPLRIIFYASDSSRAQTLAGHCFSLADSLNLVFSDYLPESELNRLSRTAGRDSFVRVSPLLWDILLKSREAWKSSFHVFDITIGPLSQLWRASRKSGQFPDPGTLAAGKDLTGFGKIILDTVIHGVKLVRKNMQLDLGGIAKGYLAQKIIDYLRSEGIVRALADAGGDMVTGEEPPASAGWRIGVNIPESTGLLPGYLLVHNKAVATSGDIYQYLEHEGRRYSHIIDPATGYGVTYQRNVTVIADDGARADWLASACSILPVRKARKLARRKKAALLITTMHKGKIQSYKTRDFDAYWKQEEKSR